MPRVSRFVVAWLALLAVVASADAVDYLKDIKPLLKNRCSSCHGSLKEKAGLRLDAGKLIHAGAKGDPVVTPGNPGESEMIRRVLTRDEDDRMPPAGTRLSIKQVALLKAWIAGGARYPAGESIPTKPKDHWAFQAVRRPALPVVKKKDWIRNEIDRFVLAKLEAKGWQPNPDANPGQLLRRTHLDLIGLPPTIAEQAVPFDYLALVDNLLGRKGYGERYARHWLDVVRYADSNAYERDGAKPEVWRYRDYVIRSLNADKRFDRFLTEQLAGDEVADASMETVVATGFNRLGPWDDEPADFAVDRYDQLDDIVNTTSQAFLGLTMGCARCHDHKFDPLSHRDYYSMVAVFNPLKRPQRGRKELTRYLAPPDLAAKLGKRDQEIAKHKTAIRQVRDDYATVFLREGRSQLPAEVQSAFLIAASKRTGDQKKLVATRQEKFDAELDAALPERLKQAIAEKRSAISNLTDRIPDVPRGYFLYEPGANPPETRLLKRGNPKTPGEVVPAAVPVVLAREQPAFLEPSKLTSRRRLSLATWMTEPSNPLTARVIVNRVWQWHFGEGLVRTPNDFGLIGERPTHPELLDWLAHWFVHEAKWSMKKLHRLIMTSRTYQMSRDTNPEYAMADPENRLLWRRSPHRLEVEAIRDSMLLVSGQLDRTMYGPAMHPFVPRDALLNHADKTSIWPKFDEPKASRRTVYAFIKRSLLVPMLEVLDLCDTTQTSPKRAVTTVPTQALTMFNGNFAMRQAKHFATRLRNEAGKSAEEQIGLAWRLALGRLPTGKELDSMKGFLSEDRSDDGLVQMCRVIFNLNEFVYPD
jgi:mono/diheme cytochrome c family protein